MSGWNPKKGTFELTVKKANWWLRRTDLGLGSWDSRKPENLEFFFELFKREGVVVVHRGSFLDVYCDGSRVWEILSGQPSRPVREIKRGRQ